jgi:hypothetical protein
MQKHISFVIAAAVLLAAFASVALSVVHIANAQSNMTSAGSNTTGATGNTTGATGNTTGATGIHTANPTSGPDCSQVYCYPTGHGVP